MAKKYYAVRKGNTTGIFENWKDCQSAISGYSHAEYKGFDTIEEANAFLSGDNIYLEQIKKDVSDGFDCIVFSDGSYDRDLHKYSYGLVIFDKSLNKHTFSSYGDNPKYRTSNNVGGEILGAINAFDWAISNNCKKIKLYYDYEGIEKWATGAWAANADIAKMYVSVFNQKFKDILDITFTHVKGHSNNPFNDEADSLAAFALKNQKKQRYSGDGWCRIDGVKLDELEVIIDSLQNDFPDFKYNKVCASGRTQFYLSLNSMKLTVQWFNTQIVLIQGTASTLFQIVLSYFDELIEEHEVVPILRSVYKIGIDKSKIEKTYKDIFPKLPTNYPSSMKVLLQQSIVNMNIFVQGFDYGQYCFPSYRALEGHIKYLLTKNGIQVHTTFDQFELVNTKYNLKSAYSLDVNEKNNIERCYNLLHDKRHSIFHFGNIMGTTSVDTTRLISTHEEAVDLITETLTTISETL